MRHPLGRIESMSSESQICYICGLPLSMIKEENDDDHVPPKQLYSKEIRSSPQFPRMFKMPTHKECNDSFSKDEQYFTHALLPVALDSYTGFSLWKEIGDQYNSGKNIPLLKKSVAEIIQRPSGLVLPYGKVLKRFDPQRVWRVVWKINRGLFFHHYGIFLPEGNSRGFDLVSPNEEPPDTFNLVRNQISNGVYPSVFDYKYNKFDYPDGPTPFHVWAMLLWDKIIVITYFHDPLCKCEQCALTSGSS